MRIVVGAGSSFHPGWLCLTEKQLDITDGRAWKQKFEPFSLEAILCEHVLEHLTEAETERAIENFYNYLQIGGYVRIAVPDGYNPSSNYLNYVKPGSWWGTLCGGNHKQIFTVDSLIQLLERHGFTIDFIEGYNYQGQWRSKWNSKQREGRITKRPGEIQAIWQSLISLSPYTSLIVDGIKL